MGVSIVICQQRVSGRASIFMRLVDSALRLQLCRYLHHVVEECKSNDANRESLPPTFWHPGGKGSLGKALVVRQTRSPSSEMGSRCIDLCLLALLHGWTNQSQCMDVLGNKPAAREVMLGECRKSKNDQRETKLRCDAQEPHTLPRSREPLQKRI